MKRPQQRRKAPSLTLLSTMWQLLLLLLAHGAAAQPSGVAHSTVQPLTAANFQSALEDPANGLWLLKFYAPWCGHCKRLAPVLDEVAPKIQGMMAIGKIDCTKEKALCKEYKVKGYPTLKFSLDGDILDYPGSRKAEHIYGFAKKMSSPPVTFVKTYQQAMDEIVAPGEQGVAFVGYHPDVVAGFDAQTNALTRVFGQVARKNQHIADFGWIGAGEESGLPQDAFSTDRPFVAKLEAGAPPRFWGMGGNDGEPSSPDLLEFVRKVNMPTVVALGPHNFNKIGRAGRSLVIGAVDGEEQKKMIHDQLLNYNLNGPISIREQYTFGWIDGRVWKKFLDQFEVTVEGLPTVFVLDVPTKVYYKSDEHPASVADLLQAVEDGNLKGKKAASTSKGIRKVFETMADLFLKYMPYSIIVLLGFVFLVAFAVMPSPDDYRPPYPNRTYDQPADLGQLEGEKDGGGTVATRKRDDDDEPKKEK